ncbi:MAG: hypothetical protein QM760_23430 [Nibricoccus sp.]
MRRFFSKLSWVVLGTAAFAVVLILSGHAPVATRSSIELALPSTPAAVSKDAVLPFAGLPLDQPRTVEFACDDPLLADFSAREKEDQVRDWLLWIVVQQAENDVGKLNSILFDIPAIRERYLRPILRFEYGRVRSCALANGEVLALVPKASVAQRADDLSGIVDEQRKNLGYMPGNMHVFEYEISGLGAAKLTRRESLSASQFSTAAGYHDVVISGVAELRDFMQQIDDLTSVHVDKSGRLRLTGRKLHTGYRGISLTEVAAVWQSEAHTQRMLDERKARIDAFKNEWERKEDSLRYRLRRTDASQYTVDREAEDFKASYDKAKQKLVGELAATGRVTEGSGFSLDPALDHVGLADVLSMPTAREAFATLSAKRGTMKRDSMLSASNEKDAPSLGLILERLGISSTDFRAAVSSLRGETANEVPLLEIVDRLQHTTGENEEVAQYIAAIVDSIIDAHRYQQARYDGPLEGTEVGMVLFYTDLLAKLWAIDFEGQTPGKEIPDFNSMLGMKFSPAYQAEMSKLRATRLWFGPEENNYQLSSKNDLFFARNVTRIYAASSSPLNPGKEVPPNANSEAFLGWWNDHYEEVARYEPEYERLNEIMKWSLVIGWLNEAGRGELLEFLRDIKVEHSFWFPLWVVNSAQLRFDLWDKVGFFEKGYQGTKTEAMPILRTSKQIEIGTHVMSGGVSLARKEIFTERPVMRVDFPTVLKKGNVNFRLSDPSAGKIVTLRGTEFKFATGSGRGPVSMGFTGPTNSKFRGKLGDIGTPSFVRTVESRANVSRVKLATEGAEVGTLEIKQARNGFRVGWQARETGDSFAIGRKLSTAADPKAVLLGDPSLRRIVRDPLSGQFYVQPHGSDRWIKFAPEKTPRPDLADGWSARVADLKPQSKIYQMKWLEADALPAEVRTGGEWIRGPPVATSSVREGVLGAPELIVADRTQLEKTVSAIVHNPSAWKSARNADFRSSLKEIADVQQQRPSRVFERIELASSRHGQQPELLLQEALAELAQNGRHAATETANRLGPLPASRRQWIFAEIDARLNTLPRETKPDAYRMAQMLDWKNSGKLPPGDVIKLTAEGDRVSLEAAVKGVPNKNPITNTGSLRDAPIYVEDAPSLNSVDWSINARKSIDQIISSGRGSLVQLPRGDLAHYRPGKLSVDSRSYNFRGSAKNTKTPATDLQAMTTRGGYAAWKGNNPDDDDDDDDEVYLLMATPGATSASL